jgi:hypothetical protein
MPYSDHGSSLLSQSGARHSSVRRQRSKFIDHECHFTKYHGRYREITTKQPPVIVYRSTACSLVRVVRLCANHLGREAVYADDEGTVCIYCT